MQAARMNVCVCVAFELNLISSGSLTMRGNKLSNERKQAVIVLTVFKDLVSLSREKRTPARSHTYRSQKRGERKKEAGVSQKNRTSPHFFLFHHLQGKKSELDLGPQPSISASQLPGSF